jgi:endoglucanase
VRSVTSRGAGRVALAAAGVLAGGLMGAAPLTVSAAKTAGRALTPDTRFYVPPPSHGAMHQIGQLLGERDVADAALIAAMEATPQAVWFTGGTPHQVEAQVRRTMALAAAQRAVPILVAYDIPGRDCAQYSAGGALDQEAYQSWITALAAGIGAAQAVVILEPDALGNLPSNCAVFGTSSYPFTDAERYAEIRYAVAALESDPGVSVYLDGTHSAWQSVGQAAQRLVTAGVAGAQGFFLNVSNYQYATNNVYYGTWISDCIALGGGSTTYDYTDNCPNQYWNGGPATGWQGTALSPYGVWSESAALPEDLDLSTAGIDSRYQLMLGSAVPSTHFVIDTSRDGRGPNSMQEYAAAPYNQPSAVISTLAAGNWCNPPASGTGLAPTARTAGIPAGLDSYQAVPDLLDAYLWVKLPGQSDGQCDAAGGVRSWDDSASTPVPGWPAAGSSDFQTFDPLWSIETGRILTDPAAGAWFPQQALQLARDADPALTAPFHR